MRRLTLIIILSSSWLFVGASASVPGEYEWRMQARYSGLFSGMARIPVADVVLSVRPRGDQAESELWLSSERYPLIETLYPVRYRFRSRFAADGARSLGFERVQKAREHKHRLVVLDWRLGRVERFELAERPTGLPLPAPLSDWPRDSELGFSKGKGCETVPGMQDFLSLLHHLRAQALSSGERFKVPVTDGKRRLDYKVVVEAREGIALGGEVWPAIRLRIRRLADTVKERGRHPPFRLWLSDDARRMPLRMSASHAIGRFEVELMEWRGESAARRIVQSSSKAM